jgi:hypothetical protein
MGPPKKPQPPPKLVPVKVKPGVVATLETLRRVARAVAIEAMGLPAGTFDRLVSQRTLPPGPERGVYDLVALFAAYVGYLDVERAEGGKGGDPEMRGERLRYLTAHADVEEIEAEQRAGKVVLVDLIDRLILEAFAFLRGEIDGNAGRLAAPMAAESDPATCRRMLLDEYRGALDRSARKLTELRLSGVVPPEPDGGVPDPAPEADGE